MSAERKRSAPRGFGSHTRDPSTIDCPVCGSPVGERCVVNGAPSKHACFERVWIPSPAPVSPVTNQPKEARS